jgi:hypothetical protein
LDRDLKLWVKRQIGPKFQISVQFPWRFFISI